MAILFHKQLSGHTYEVRSAGRTRRMYTDGVFHSQYNPQHGVTGSVWDLLFLPSQFYAPGELKRVLVLGVGGGAVIHMLNQFSAPEQIIGVELSRIHLQLAKRFFDLRYRNLQLVCANAIEWLIEYDGEPFDLIIDDLYSERDGEPERAIAADASWFDVLMDNLSERGMLVMNFVDLKDWKQSAYFKDAFVSDAFPAAYRFTTPTCRNAVVALQRQPKTLVEFRSRLREQAVLDERRAGCRLRYKVQALKVSE